MTFNREQFEIEKKQHSEAQAKDVELKNVALDFLTKADRHNYEYPSYLPYCRGSDPAVWTIRCEFPAGVTLHCISDKVDEGAIWAQKQLPCKFAEKGKFLYEKLLHQCVEIFKEKWEDIRNLKISPRAQVNIPKSRTNLRKNLFIDRVLKNSDTMTVKDFILRINAHDFSPDYTAICDLEGEKYKITLNLEEIHE